MTIAVIGANGRSGREFTERALAAGHKIRAGMRHIEKTPPNDNLTIVSCDATQESDVRKLLKGCDVVVSMIGHGRHSPPRVQTESIKIVARVMQELGINRLISLTGTGVRFPGDKPNLIDYLANFAIRIIDPNRVQDGIDHAQFLQTTNLDWTIIRVLKLSNTPHHGDVLMSLAGPAELFTPRARVAEAALQIIEDQSYIRQAPVITSRINP